MYKTGLRYRLNDNIKTAVFPVVGKTDRVWCIQLTRALDGHCSPVYNTQSLFNKRDILSHNFLAFEMYFLLNSTESGASFNRRSQGSVWKQLPKYSRPSSCR